MKKCFSRPWLTFLRVESLSFGAFLFACLSFVWTVLPHIFPYENMKWNWREGIGSNLQESSGVLGYSAENEGSSLFFICFLCFVFFLRWNCWSGSYFDGIVGVEVTSMELLEWKLLRWNCWSGS